MNTTPGLQRDIIIGDETGAYFNNNASDLPKEQGEPSGSGDGKEWSYSFGTATYRTGTDAPFAYITNGEITLDVRDEEYMDDDYLIPIVNKLNEKPQPTPEVKSREEILYKHLVVGDETYMGNRNGILKAMEEYSSIQNEELRAEVERLKAERDEAVKTVGYIQRNAEKITEHTWKVYKEQILCHCEDVKTNH